MRFIEEVNVVRYSTLDEYAEFFVAFQGSYRPMRNRLELQCS